MKRICYLASTRMTVNSFLAPHIRNLVVHGYSVSLITNLLPAITVDSSLPVKHIHLGLTRKPALLSDLLSFLRLVVILKRGNFDLLHTVTPKAGLLGMLASFVAGVKCRVHVFTGQVWSTRSGITRFFYKAADSITAALASHVLVDSVAQREFLLSEGVCVLHKAVVIGYGSICGVDTQRFSPNMMTRLSVRKKLNVSNDAVVLLFLGRITLEKGVVELVDAFTGLSQSFPNVLLWLVGDDEEGLTEVLRAKFHVHPERITLFGHTQSPEEFMQSADIFCMPSHREGFGNSVLEAGACGLPVVVSRIYGLMDSVKEGETGWMHSDQNPRDLEKVLRTAISDPREAKRRGGDARLRAIRFFEQSYVVGETLKFYKNILCP